MAQDELSVDIAAAAAEASKSLSTDKAIESAIETSDLSPELDETVDTENGEFWGEDDELDFGSSKAKASENESDDEDADVPQGNEIISYKANGKEVKLNLNDANDREKLTKDLALVDGARKAFSDKNALRQRLKKIETDQANLAKYKESWDKLESIKEDPAELYRVLTGEDFNTMIEREAEKRSIYSNASEEDRKIMDYEDRIRRMELAQERESTKRTKELEKIEARKYEADKSELHGKMQQEFFKYEFPEDLSPVAANRLRKMLWRNSVADVQDYIKQGYKFSDRMVNKAFKDNASAVQAFYKNVANKESKAGTEARKSEASEKAAAAATKNYKQPSKDIDDMVSKDPLSIFQAFRRGRR